jgi:hypothetical protein
MSPTNAESQISFTNSFSQLTKCVLPRSHTLSILTCSNLMVQVVTSILKKAACTDHWAHKAADGSNQRSSFTTTLTEDWNMKLRMKPVSTSLKVWRIEEFKVRRWTYGTYKLQHTAQATIISILFPPDSRIVSACFCL